MYRRALDVSFRISFTGRANSDGSSRLPAQRLLYDVKAPRVLASHQIASR